MQFYPPRIGGSSSSSFNKLELDGVVELWVKKMPLVRRSFMRRLDGIFVFDCYLLYQLLDTLQDPLVSLSDFGSHVKAM